MITDDDIIYQDNKIAILHNTCSKGVIIGSHTTLKKVGFLHFDIPFYARKINYTSPIREICSLYGFMWLFQKKRIFIRVDPEKTYIDFTNIKLSDYMKKRETMSLFRQFLYNNSRHYHISVDVSHINASNTVPLHL
jgi:hypothetical protein